MVAIAKSTGKTQKSRIPRRRDRDRFDVAQRTVDVILRHRH